MRWLSACLRGRRQPVFLKRAVDASKVGRKREDAEDNGATGDRYGSAHVLT
jgi:hypothetical protein